MFYVLNRWSDSSDTVRLFHVVVGVEALADKLA